MSFVDKLRKFRVLMQIMPMYRGRFSLWKLVLPSSRWCCAEQSLQYKLKLDAWLRGLVARSYDHLLHPQLACDTEMPADQAIIPHRQGYPNLVEPRPPNHIFSTWIDPSHEPLNTCPSNPPTHLPLDLPAVTRSPPSAFSLDCTLRSPSDPAPSAHTIQIRSRSFLFRPRASVTTPDLLRQSMRHRPHHNSKASIILPGSSTRQAHKLLCFQLPSRLLHPNSQLSSALPRSYPESPVLTSKKRTSCVPEATSRIRLSAFPDSNLHNSTCSAYQPYPATASYNHFERSSRIIPVQHGQHA